jgi:hypothetical protein
MGNCSNQWRINGSLHNAYRLELEGHSMRRTADGPTEKVDEGHPA